MLDQRQLLLRDFGNCREAFFDNDSNGLPQMRQIFLALLFAPLLKTLFPFS